MSANVRLIAAVGAFWGFWGVLGGLGKRKGGKDGSLMVFCIATAGRVRPGQAPMRQRIGMIFSAVILV